MAGQAASLPELDGDFGVPGQTGSGASADFDPAIQAGLVRSAGGGVADQADSVSSADFDPAIQAGLVRSAGGGVADQADSVSSADFDVPGQV